MQNDQRKFPDLHYIPKQELSVGTLYILQFMSELDRYSVLVTSLLKSNTSITRSPTFSIAWSMERQAGGLSGPKNWTIKAHYDHET